jgi:hypothetical protein
MRQSPAGKGAVLSAAASLVSLLAALSCCLPLGTMLLAAGSAGASVLSEALRPWLLWFSVACIVVAFVQTYFRGRCDFRHRRLRTLLLWVSATLVGATLIAPNFTARILAGLPVLPAAGELRPFTPPAFLREFDAASSGTRLVLLLSPT